MFYTVSTARVIFTGKQQVSECWRFDAVPTARVIFTAKRYLDVFSLSQEQVWTF